MDGLNIPYEMLPLFFVIAFLYSSVGHGGASGYLAIFALFGIVSPSIAPIVLALNVVVASTSFFSFYRAGHFDWRLLLPFLVASIPAAFAGGFIAIPQAVFSALLGLALLLAASRILFLNQDGTSVVSVERKKLWMWGIPIGAILGFISGMLGIGGGVFLSPLILLMKWADLKRTAAISAAFIVLNSLSGLVGHIARANFDFQSLVPLLIVVVAGGVIGSRMGSFRMQTRHLQGILAIVLVVAGVKLVSKFIL